LIVSVIQIIDEFDVLPNESENHAPVALTVIEWNPELAGQGIANATRALRDHSASSRIQCRQLQSQPGRVLRLDSGLGARLKNASSLCDGSF